MIHIILKISPKEGQRRMKARTLDFDRLPFTFLIPIRLTYVGVVISRFLTAHGWIYRTLPSTLGYEKVKVIATPPKIIRIDLASLCCPAWREFFGV